MKAADIDTLPDDVLGRIFALSGNLQHATAPLRAIASVCKRWRRVLLSEREVWRAVRIAYPPAWPFHLNKHLSRPQKKEWHAGKAWLLRRVGGLVEHAELQGSMAGHAHLLQPGVLRTLHLAASSDSGWSFVPREQRRGYAAAVVAAALWRFPALLGLQLVCDSLPICATDGLRQLSQLRSLEVRIRDPFPTAALDAVLQLSELTALHLHSRGPGGFDVGPQQELLQLTRLHQLASLHISANHAEVLHYPTPADFPALASYSFSACPVPVHAAMQVAGARMNAAGYGWSYGDWEWVQKGGKLQVYSLHTEGSLLPLLAALLPAAAPLPTRVYVQSGHVMFDPAAATEPAHAVLAAAATKLACVTDLSFDELRVLDDPDLLCSTMPDLLAQLLPLMPRLADLSIAGGELGSTVPPCIVGLTGLTELALPGNGLEELPPGDYLTGLASLALDRNRFVRMPPALAAATRLRHLTLEGCNGVRWMDPYIGPTPEPAGTAQQMHPLVQRMRAELAGAGSGAAEADEAAGS